MSNFTKLGTSPQESALKIRQHFQSEFGIDLDIILKGGPFTARQFRRKVNPILEEAVAKKHNVSVAELNDAYDSLFANEDDDSGVESNFNFIINQETYDDLKAARGGDVEDYVSGFANLMTQASGLSGGVLAGTLVAGGIIAIGGAMLKYVVSEMAKDAALTLLKAVTNFLSSGTLAVGIVLFFLQALVQLFLFLATLTREFTGLVLNGTTHNFVVNNWKEGALQGKNDGIYMDAGELDSFMNNPTVENQLMAMTTLTVEGTSENCYAMGLFSGAKNFGFLGVGGYIQFNSDDLEADQSYVAMFANPYSHTSGTSAYITTSPIGDQSDFYNKIYENRSLFTTVSSYSNGWQAYMQSACNSEHGDQSYGIFVLE
ncbi:MAG: hypothetical protein NXI10_03095 [bacterium]|nr:hypothetical protein [bacterium]